MPSYSSESKEDPNDETLVTKDDVFLAMTDIADESPELMQYILTCYPPELMLHISPEIKKIIENANVQSDKKDNH